MKIIEERNDFCTGCLSGHKIQVVEIQEEELYKDKLVKFIAEYNYCNIYDILTENEEQIRKNLKRMKEEYNKNL